MPLFQPPAVTDEAVDASRPVDIPVEEVLGMEEDEWYARVHRPAATQLTVRSVVLGSVLGFFLAFTNIYIGLKTGWFFGVSLTAALVSFGVLNGVRNLASSAPGWPFWKRALLLGPWLFGMACHRLRLPRSELTILENTSVISVASSAGNATGITLVSAIPALLMLSVTEENRRGTQLPALVVAGWIFFLAVFGVTLGIPLKRGMINRQKLKFPSGTATAMTLRSLHDRGREATARARALFITALASAIVPLVKDLDLVRSRDVAVDPNLRFPLLPAASNVFDFLGRTRPWQSWANAGPAKLHADGRAFLPSDYLVKLDHGPALVFAGMIVGIRITGWMLAGALFLVGLARYGLDDVWRNGSGILVTAVSRPALAWKEIGIWAGAPMLVASGLVGFAAQWRLIGRALGGLWRRAPDAHAAVEVPASWFVSGLVVSTIGIITMARLWFEIPIHYGLLAIALTFVLSVVACRATGETDLSPSGPLGKVMQLTYGILIPQSSTANLQTAAITTGASYASADLLSDLKTGYLLGASPRRQVVAQALGVLMGTFASTLAYFVLVPDALPLVGTPDHLPTFMAPAAQQWKAVALVFRFGMQNLHPMARAAIAWGTAAGVVLGLAENVVPVRLRRLVPSASGIGLGLVLPFFYPLSMFLGAAIAEAVTARSKAWAGRYLVPIAAGGIAGESVVGVIVQALNQL